MRVMDDVHENRLLSRWAAALPRGPRPIHGIHEADAELVPLPSGGLLALTVDSVAEEIATGLYRSPYTAGRTAAVAALSDLAAAGAEPLGLLLSVGLPAENTAAVQGGVARGVAEACAEAGTHVLGGDTGASPLLTVTCMAAGHVPAEAARLRVGLRPGDRIYASGPLGLGSALAAARWLELGDVFSEADYRPPVRVAVGRALRRVASAAMDTSDGLVATLDQLARLNRVRLHVTRPLAELLHEDAARVRERAGLSAFTFLAGHHGEFELVFGVAASHEDDLDVAAAQIGWEPLELGRVEEGEGLVLGGRRVDGARVRNLLGDVNGDVAAYVRGLEALAP